MDWPYVKDTPPNDGKLIVTGSSCTPGGVGYAEPCTDVDVVKDPVMACYYYKLVKENWMNAGGDWDSLAADYYFHLGKSDGPGSPPNDANALFCPPAAEGTKGTLYSQDSNTMKEFNFYEQCCKSAPY
jgi:hypothetical protein